MYNLWALCTLNMLGRELGPQFLNAMWPSLSYFKCEQLHPTRITMLSQPPKHTPTSLHQGLTGGS